MKLSIAERISTRASQRGVGTNSRKSNGGTALGLVLWFKSEPLGCEQGVGTHSRGLVREAADKTATGADCHIPALHRYTAPWANTGSDKWTQFPFIYLSVVWTTEHMLVCPAINLDPVNTAATLALPSSTD